MPVDRWGGAHPGGEALVALGWGHLPGCATWCEPDGGNVNGQFLSVPGSSFSRCHPASFCAFTREIICRGLWDYVALPL